ncbi:LuxE/PaaK family acyltransferase [Anaeromyxobacter paludicola]|uniref:Acyl-protein synthetase n=1 Tax=Anaeromyxobacter paludicola TaxID=2918171 RepID=A0ABN6N1N5_9BACT|nr:hypothetical protein [Anaeromyxobacter paludicola]BDG07091.1 acyl-protein synthetase [Anaeromyxobacter paludicola]
MSIADFFEVPPFGVDPVTRRARLLEELLRLQLHHAAGCAPYARLLGALHPGASPARLEEVPWVPVGLFKSHRLSSVPESAVFKVMRSSGTTGQAPSQVVLDRETAELQSRALARIIGAVAGQGRLPMLIVERRDLLRRPEAGTARGAGVLGFMMAGRNHFFCLDEGYRLDVDGLRAWLARHGDAPFLVFGFTFLVWQHLAEEARGLGLDLSRGILFHGGGWKKLQARAVGAAAFRDQLRDAVRLERVHSFYGMIEQVGSVFVEGGDGWLHVPSFAEVIVRDPRTLEALPPGQVGVIEVLSVLPRSYPGHAILTEDLGVVHALDAPEAGFRGTAFSVLGRVPRAEPRGCSDTLQPRTPEA